MLGKTFKGLTDEMLDWQTRGALGARGLDATAGWSTCARSWWSRSRSRDVQESPRYPAGLALRFARVQRYRPEKPAAEADTLQSVRAIFERQRA